MLNNMAGSDPVRDYITFDAFYSADRSHLSGSNKDYRPYYTMHYFTGVFYFSLSFSYHMQGKTRGKCEKSARKCFYITLYIV